jgi:hypothetical protein
MEVDEFTIKLVAGITLDAFCVSTKLTVVSSPAKLLKNPVPVIVMDVPPAADPVGVPPLAIEILETVGTTGWYVYWAAVPAELDPFGVLTMM